MRNLVLFLLIFLSACTPAADIQENRTIQNITGNESFASPVSENASSNATYERILTPERQRLREARLTLDFSLLTAENCDATEELHAKNITKINDAWEGLQEDLDKQEEKAGKLSDELRMETQGSARWE